MAAILSRGDHVNPPQQLDRYVSIADPEHLPLNSSLDTTELTLGHETVLTHGVREKMAAILQTTY